LPPRNLRDNDRSGHATNADKIIAKGVTGGNFARIRVQIVTEDHVRVEAVPKRMLNTGSAGQKLAMNSYQGIKPIFCSKIGYLVLNIQQNIMRGWICIYLVLS
jgi:hypothetical protein